MVVLDALLGPLMRAVRALEQYLGPEDDWVEDDRRVIHEWLDRYLGEYYPWLVIKVGHYDYVTTAAADPDKVEVALMEHGYQRNVLSGRKWRDTAGGKQWAVGSFVLPAGDFQHHVYLFPRAGGGTDVYAHREDSVTDPDAHLNINDGPDDMGQENGVSGSALDALDEADIHHTREKLAI